MAKLKRSALAHYFKQDVLSSEWFLIGKDIEDMSVEMNGSFETTTNILDETSVSDTGYAPSISVSPYYANPDDSVYEFLKDLALNRKSGDQAKAKLLEVLIDDTSAEQHDAWEEDAIIEINNYGGGTNGVTIEYTIHPNGNRKAGHVTIENKVPTFVAD